MRNMAKLRVMPEIAGFSATKLQNFSELPTPRRFSKNQAGRAGEVKTRFWTISAADTTRMPVMAHEMG